MGKLLVTTTLSVIVFVSLLSISSFETIGKKYLVSTKWYSEGNQHEQHEQQQQQQHGQQENQPENQAQQQGWTSSLHDDSYFRKRRLRPTRSRLKPLFCRECQRAFLPDGPTCLEKLQKTIRKKRYLNMEGYRKAMMAIATTTSSTPNDNNPCRACHPEKCAVRTVSQFPLGFDEASPRVLHSVTYTTLSSIPQDRIIPPDVEAYQARYTTNQYGPIAIYNPSIVPLPPLTRDTLDLQNQPHDRIPSYLISFRTTMAAACWVVPFQWQQNHSDYVGLAVLDQHLRLMDGLEAVIDLNQQLGGTRYFEDYRLFDVNGTLHLAQAKQILPIHVLGTRTPPPPTTNLSNNDAPKRTRVFSNLYGKGLVVSSPFTAPARHYNRVDGKNFNYFRSLSGQYWLEAWPIPHAVIPVDHISQNEKLMISQTLIQPNSSGPLADWSDEDLLVGRKLHSPDRGSACCVRLEPQYYQDLVRDDDSIYNVRLIRQQPFLYVGISHTKSVNKLPKINTRIFLSRMYAFVPVEPFPLVARSASFCFGNSDADTTPPPYYNLTHRKSLTVNDRVYDCPTIHFVSGMTEHVQDPSSVIVAYGIEDCVARTVQLHKRDLALHLFTPLDTENATIHHGNILMKHNKKSKSSQG